MRKRISELKKFNWRLWISLCALSLIPAIYQTVKTLFISSSGQSVAFNIIGQSEWFDLINETLQAFLIVPLYSVLNRIFKNRRGDFAAATFKARVCVFLPYTAFSIGVLIYGSALIRAMNPAGIDLAAASAYLRLETLGFIAGIIADFAGAVFIVIGKSKNVYIFLAVRTVLALISDFFLIGKFGIYGAAISNIITGALLSAASVLLLCRQGYLRFGKFSKADGKMLCEWCKIGAFSGFQQFLDNFIYAIMICKMVNAVSQQGNYWIANNFIWGWLLIPISALGEVIRSDCKQGYKNLRQFNYYFTAAANMAFWAVSVPAWEPFFRHTQGLENAGEIFAVVIKLVPFYIAYAGSVILDNIFIGLGKTGYNAINSLIINLGYYGIFYILYRAGYIAFDMNTIIMMFGFGMAVHYAVSLIEEKVFLKKKLRKTDKLTE